jgi:LacI family transcriptional regulator, galactose operon repressor
LTSADAAKPPERTRFVGVLVPYVRGGYFPEILEGIAEAVYEHGLRLVLSPTQHEHGREVSLLDRLMQGATHGAVVILPEETTEELEQALSDRYPFVVVDPLLPLGDRIPTVLGAHRSGADQAVRHLLTLGHRRIAAITGPPGWLATEERRAAYHATLADAGIRPEPTFEVASDFQVGPAVQAAATLLDLPEPPTAIFAFNDSIAFGALRAARDRGLRVPEDLSVVGFDDIEPSILVTPALTTVRQPLGEMGRTAVNVLVRLLERRASEAPHIELATRLVVRESTAPPRRSAAG